MKRLKTRMPSMWLQRASTRVKKWKSAYVEFIEYGGCHIDDKREFTNVMFGMLSLTLNGSSPDFAIIGRMLPRRGREFWLVHDINYNPAYSNYPSSLGPFSTLREALDQLLVMAVVMMVEGEREEG